MALNSKVTLFIYFVFMLKLVHMQGANNGFMVSTYATFDGRIKAYQGDVDSMVNAATPPSLSLGVRYSFITSLTAEPRNESLYFLDIQYKSIYKLNNINIRFNNTKMSFTRLHEGISVAIGSIVFDWISRNIYWTDRYHNWISVMPVTTNDPLMFRPVVEEGVSVPVTLAIDPKNGYLFWSDTQPSVRIEWSDLLGENREVMLYGNMKFITAMAVDPGARKVYFADYLRQTLEKVEYGGLNRSVLIRLNTYRLIDMMFYKNYLCLVEQRYQNTLCFNTSGYKVLSDKLPANPWGICVFDESTQSENFTDYCSEKNCSHFCVNMPTEARCVCKEGYDLQTDNITCIANHSISGKGLIFTNGTNICIVHITAVTGSKIKPECIVSNLGDGLSYLQADSNNGKIHFWNSTGMMLQTYDLLAKTSTLITFTGQVTGLFYDWTADDLYWSEAESNLIKVAALKVATAQVTDIFTQVTKPRYLTGNPHKYVLYWISGNNTGSIAILRGTFSGTNVTTIVPSNKLNNPVGLLFDEVRNRLYWIDNGQVNSISVDGTGEESHFKVSGATSLLIYKDYLIWTTVQSEIRAAFLRSTSLSGRINLSAHGQITGACVYDSRLQRKERGPCEDDNGDCQHICLPSSSGAICRCKIGYKLADDGQTCESAPLTNNFALLVDYTHDMIFQVPTDLESVTEDNFVALDIPDVESPIGVLYDNATGYIYWSELYNQQIRKTKLGSTNATTVIKLDKWYPDRMVMDQSTGYIYYTAIVRNQNNGPISYIGVLRLDLDPDEPKNKQLLKGLYQPRGLAIHPKKGLLFWSEIGSSKPYIGKSGMDGQNVSEFVNGSKVKTPIGLAIDFTDAREYLYWADLVDDVIRRVSLDGSDYEVFYKDGAVSHPSDVFIQGAYLYYISWNKRKISILKKDSATEVLWMPDIPDLGRLDNLQIFPADKQPTNAVCGDRNGGCSTFCLLKPNDIKVCSCEEGVNMRKDNKTCENVCNSIFPNGMIEKDCTIYPGAVCGYSCNTNYKKNIKVDNITCFKNMSWSKSNLCEPIMCDLVSVNITNGRVNNECTGQAGIICDYTCDSGYEKRQLNSTFQCLADGVHGVWNTDFKGFCKPITCDITTINIKNGRVKSGCKENVGAICEYECNSGFKRNEVFSNFNCTSKGVWNTDFKEFCKSIECDLTIINIAHGKVKSGCLGKIEEVCEYTCDSGYERNGTFSTFNCTAAGVWDTDFKGFCKPITCDLNSINIVNGRVANGCTGNVWETCNYTCDSGYRKSDVTPTLQCKENGVWNTDFKDLCKLISCDLSIVNIANGRVQSGCTGRVGENCDYTCDNGYEKNDATSTFQCMPNGVWNTDFKGFCKIISCDISSINIANGRVNNGCTGQVGKSCDYTCNSGYEKSGDIQTFQCQATGVWNTDFKGLCKPITCDLNSINIANGRVKNGCTGQWGQTCDYTCDSGFIKSGVMTTFQCTSSGVWNTDFKGFCKSIKCDLNSINIANGNVKNGCTGQVGDSCDYMCDNGYEKSKTIPNFQCTSNGVWNTDFKAFCKPVTCDISSISIANGRVKSGCEGKVGGVCEYECNSGFIKGKGSSTFSCTTNGVWNTDFKDFCTPIRCNITEPIHNGRLSTNCKGLVGIVCNYTCDTGYQGNIKNLFCLSNGTWSSALKDVCKKSSETSPIKQTAGSNAGVIGGVIGGIFIAILLIVAVIIFVVCYLNRRKLSQQGVYKNNPNLPFKFDNPYTTFENPAEPSTDGSTQFTNPLTGVEQPTSTMNAEKSSQSEIAPIGATGGGTTERGRGVQFSNPLCFIDDAYVTVSDKKRILPDEDVDDTQAFYLRDVGEKTLTFNQDEKDSDYKNISS